MFIVEKKNKSFYNKINIKTIPHRLKAYTNVYFTLFLRYTF